MLHPAAARVVAAAVAAAYLGALAFAVDPFGGPDLCPLHRLTGLDCPGCGVTRATWLLLHGDPAGAIRHNAALLPVALAVALHLAGRLPRRALPAVALALAAFGVARNLPGLEVLAPPT